MNGIIRGLDSGARRGQCLAVLLLAGGFVFLPALMALAHHGPPLRPLTVQTTAPRSCIEGACHEAERCIQEIVTHIVLRLPVPSLLVLALLLVSLPFLWRAHERTQPLDWWWPPDRRRAFLQVFLI